MKVLVVGGGGRVGNFDVDGEDPRARGGPGVCPVCDTTDGAWRPIVPSLPGLYWFKNNQGQAVVTHNAGREFTFIGTDEAMSPEAMVEDGGKFWSKPLTPPELD